MSENGNPNPLKQAIGALQKIEARLDKAVIDGPTGSFKHSLHALEDVAGTEASNIRNVVEILKRVDVPLVEVEMRYAFCDEDDEEATIDYFGDVLGDIHDKKGSLIFKFLIPEDMVQDMYLMMQILAGLDMPMQTMLDMGMFVNGERYEK